MILHENLNIPFFYSSSKLWKAGEKLQRLFEHFI